MKKGKNSSGNTTQIRLLPRKEAASRAARRAHRPLRELAAEDDNENPKNEVRQFPVMGEETNLARTLAVFDGAGVMRAQLTFSAEPFSEQGLIDQLNEWEDVLWAWMNRYFRYSAERPGLSITR